MADLIPIVRLNRVEKEMISDCACPDADWPSPAIHWAGQSDFTEHDCACPDVGLATQARSPLNAGLWRRAPDLYRAALPDQQQVVFAPLPSAGIAVLNTPARRILDEFAIPRRPPQIVGMLPDLEPDDVTRTILQLASQGLLQPAEETQTPCLAPPHTFTVWLHVTNQCNLNCAYCYVHKNGEAMDEATGRAAVDAAFQAASGHGFQAVKLKYAGGEPTLNFGLVHSLHLHARVLAGRYNLALREVLLSNGVALSDPMLAQLRQMNIRLAISLDGVGPAHDAQRGAGTFSKTARTIDRAIAMGLQPHLSITVTAQNAADLANVVTYALDRGLTFNLNFYREHNRALPNVDLKAENVYLIEGIRAALAHIETRLPQQNLVGGLIDRANFNYPHSRPCGVGQSYVVIDQRGHIARCQMDMEHTVGTVWENDLLTAVRSLDGGFQNLKVDAKNECSTCIWRYWCGGGCPLLTYRLTGRNDLKSPYCETYRVLFPEVLRLEGLRLLKWRPPTV